MFESSFSLLFKLKCCQEEGSNFPKSLNSEVNKIDARLKKLTAKANGDMSLME